MTIILAVIFFSLVSCPTPFVLVFHASRTNITRVQRSRASFLRLCIDAAREILGSGWLSLRRRRSRAHTCTDARSQLSITRGRSSGSENGSAGRATGFDFGCLVTFCFDRRGEGWSGQESNTERVSGRRHGKKAGGTDIRSR